MTGLRFWPVGKIYRYIGLQYDIAAKIFLLEKKAAVCGTCDKAVFYFLSM